VRKTTFAAGAIALVLVLSACGGGGQASSGGTPSPTSGASAVAAGTPAAGDLASVLKATTSALESKKSVKLALEASEDGKPVTGTGQARYGDQNVTSMTIESAGQKSEVVFADNTLYVKLPADQLASLHTTKPWLKLAGNSADPTAKALAGSLGDAASGSDPAKALDLLGKAGTLTSTEKVQLGGQAVTHYVVDVDYSKAADQLPAGIPGPLRDSLKTKGVHAPMDLWINGDQLPVQVTTDVGPLLKAAGAPSTGSTKSTVKYSDWGTQVTVQAPPADQVADFAEVLKAMSGDSTQPTG
jgi:hypothetical protein